MSLRKEKMSINLKGSLFSLDEPLVMGILNVTPDSFYSGSRCQSEQAIMRRAEDIVNEGGAIIDVGSCLLYTSYIRFLFFYSGREDEK